MKVDSGRSIRDAGRAKAAKKSSSGGADFARRLGGADQSDSAGAADTLTGIGPVAGLDALLSVQNVDPDGGGGNKRAYQRAEDLLDKLDELRLFLIAGGIPRDKLLSLSHLAQSHRDQVDDPNLAGLLDEIDLRVQVELAKYVPRQSRG